METPGERQIRPVGVLDSGVGGLSVIREIRRYLPHEDILYFADSGNCPYGVRPPAEIRDLAESAAAFLLRQGAKALVIACNTASTAAVAYLRELWPAVPIVGMVPAVKPAARMTTSGVIGVLATEATGQAPVLLDVIDRFASDVKVLIAAPPGLVEAVEEGRSDSLETRAILEKAVEPMLENGADALVLGCTHFPFLRPALENILQGKMHLIDSGDAVARQTVRVLEAANLLHPQARPGRIFCYTSGDVALSRPVIAKLLNLPDPESLSLAFVPADRPRSG
ncbi:MAG: Glutamate racemase [Chloroflexi bacterium]|nr:Glutamate racemase [Chloroflexota bacterium]